MLTVEQLQAAIAELNDEPLAVNEIKNMYEILAGLVRNLPLRSDRKNALLLQVYLGELAINHSLYTESAQALSVVSNALISYSQQGLLPASFNNRLIYLANLVNEAVVYLEIVSNVS